MKKLVAAVLTGVLVAGNFKAQEFTQRMMTRQSQLQRLQHHMQKFLKKQSQFLRKKDMTLKLPYLTIM